MKAVIMAGGKGTRLASVLADVPKPMVPIAGKPLLEYQIENLRDCGVTDVIIVIGHKGQVIKEYFKDGKKFSINIMYFCEESPLGTAGALFYLKDYLKEDFILLFGDVFVDINFQKLYTYHQEKGGVATLYTHPNSHPYDSDLVITDEENHVTGWIYKNANRSEDYNNQVNAGAYIFSPQILNRIAENQKTDLEKQIIVSYINERSVFAYYCSEYVKDIGTPERLKKVEKDYLNGVCQQKNLKNKQKCIFLDRDGTINRHIGFLNHPSQVELENNVTAAIKKINESGFLAIIVSNQPVLARGECTFEEMDRIHKRLYTLLGNEGAYVDALYYCPHHPDKGFPGEVIELKQECKCRKPNTGMVEKAVKEFNIDLEQSWIIGDTTLDIQMGKNAGVKTMLLMTGEAGKDGKYDVKADVVFEDLLQGINYVLEEG
ncbi:HAD-IIIA family hydrolase [Lachnospiraceae bacterium OttesenSCG-928-D06]|nr:HAD-IIIA family hydrolase [Lachnospiraceae bacterium OttesenSCG-928-D06]